ncbi:hypothetical protein CI610_03649 [invertebrate metagenome]|uniref:Uncharacterized protein n=1 Tax=invertebrate metagenome TaxID=1711999 RepID=A0A2H9T2I8_9ZZZZ
MFLYVDFKSKAQLKYAHITNGSYLWHQGKFMNQLALANSKHL